MEIKDRVLIVEDDKNIRKFIQTILEANDYDVIATETGKEAYSLITSRCPDVVILDLGLPDMDGMKILKEVRAWSNMPIIVVSARDHEKDKVEALDMGADDYITKPFGTSELLARIRAAIRHFRGTSKNQGERQKVTFLNGKLVIDYDKHRVYVEEQDAGLTQNEFRLLSLLGKYALELKILVSANAVVIAYGAVGASETGFDADRSFRIGLSLLSGYDNHPIRPAGAVKSSRSSILQNRQ